MITLGPAGTGGEVCSGMRFIKEKGLTALEVEFTYGVRMSNAKAREIKILNSKLGLILSVHAPYFINLASLDADKIQASKKRILDSCERAHHMGAKYVVFHPGFLLGRKEAVVYGIIKKGLIELLDVIKKNNWDILLAPETAGKLSQFGSLDSLLRLKEEIGCQLCVDFAHLYAVTQGKIDFGSVLDKLHSLNHVHSHCSGIEFTLKGEKKHIKLDPGFFLPLAKEIVARNTDITIISESPVTWKDSLLMKSIISELKPQAI